MSVLVFDAKSGVPQQCYGTLDEIGLCGEMLADDVNRCPVCSYYVAWKRSKTWTAQFGKWRVFVNRVLSTPADEMGVALLASVGNNIYTGEPITRFAVPHDLTRWRKIASKMSRGEIREVLMRCRLKKTKNRRGQLVELRGDGLVNYILSACEKQIRERPVAVKQESAFEGLVQDEG